MLSKKRLLQIVSVFVYSLYANANIKTPSVITTDDEDNRVIALGNAKQISSGLYHQLVLKSNGTLWAWGKNDKGQLGLGHKIDQNVPVQVGEDRDWKTVIDTHANYSLAQKSDGTLWSWGLNSVCQLSVDSNPEYQTKPVKISNDTDWSYISASNSKISAIKEDGTLWSWDYSYLCSSPEPKRVESEAKWNYVYTDDVKRLLIDIEGQLWFYGRNVDITNELEKDSIVHSPFKLNFGGDWKQVVAPGNNFVALKEDGSVWIWGKFGDISINGVRSTPDYIFSPKKFPVDGKNIKSLYANIYRKYVIDDSKKIYFLDENFPSSIVDAHPEIKYSLQEQPSIENWVQFSLRGFNRVNYFVDANGIIHIQHVENSVAQYPGDNSLKILNSPENLSAWPKLKAISAGFLRTWVIDEAGQIFVWGSYLGEVPVGEWARVNGLENERFVEITSSDFADKVIVRHENGSYWGRGYLWPGIVASANSDFSLIPDSNNWKDVKLCVSHHFILKDDGSLWGWGNNDRGQLGIQGLESTTVPIQIGNDSDWQSVFCQSDTSYAIKSDGSLWVWGSLFDKESAKSVSQFEPKQIYTAHKWRDLATWGSTLKGIDQEGILWSLDSSNSHDQALKTESEIIWQKIIPNQHAGGFIQSIQGNWYALGYNNDGTLAAGESIGQTFNSPEPMNTEVKFADISSSGIHSIGISPEGELYVWGKNDNGKFGMGVSNKTSYVLLPADEQELKIQGSPYAKQELNFSIQWAYSLPLHSLIFDTNIDWYLDGELVAEDTNKYLISADSIGKVVSVLTSSTLEFDQLQLQETNQVDSVKIRHNEILISDIDTIKATESTEFSYQVIAEFEGNAGDKLAYELVSGPEGMSVDENGLIKWSVGAVDNDYELNLELQLSVPDNDFIHHKQIIIPISVLKKVDNNSPVKVDPPATIPEKSSGGNLSFYPLVMLLIVWISRQLNHNLRIRIE